MPILSYDQEKTELEQAIFHKLPKEVRKLACDLDIFIQQDNITPQNIINKTYQKIIESNNDIQPLVQMFNQRHPTHPYNADTFGIAVQAPVKQALTTQFKTSIERSATQIQEKKFILSEEPPPPTPPKIKPK